jgi:hypothetical protein
MFTGMYWPLIGGLIALVLVSIILGWIMDTSRRDRDADRRPGGLGPRR